MERGKEIHIHPLGDLREHLLDRKKCWCRPVEEEPGIIVHNSLDRREDYEGKMN